MILNQSDQAIAEGVIDVCLIGTITVFGEDGWVVYVEDGWVVYGEDGWVVYGEDGGCADEHKIQ